MKLVLRRGFFGEGFELLPADMDAARIEDARRIKRLKAENGFTSFDVCIDTLVNYWHIPRENIIIRI